jgi:hypothetical protein
MRIINVIKRTAKIGLFYENNDLQTPQYSKISLLVFALIFTGVGSYVVYSSKAATMPVLPTATSRDKTTQPLVEAQGVPVSSAVNATNLNIGETNIASTDDTGNGNAMLAQSTILSQSATIQTMSFYVVAEGGNLQLGIYDSTGPGGSPGAKLAQTSELTPTVGWNTVNTTSHPMLSAGTYWLAYLPQSNNLSFRFDGTGSAKYYPYGYHTMPIAFSTNPTSVTGHWSLYASVTTDSSITSPPALTR